MSDARVPSAEQESPGHEEDLAWLGHLHLFQGLPEEVRRAFLARARKREVQPGTWLIEHLDPNPPFVLLQTGRAEVFTRYGERPHLLGIIENQDHVGAEAILANRRSPISVRTLRPVVYFQVEGAHLLRLARRFPDFGRRLRLIAESHRRAREQRPSWLPAREWVLVFTQRHPIVLWMRWALAGIVGGIFTLLFVIAAVITGLMGFLGLAGLTLSLTLGVLAWIWIEWRNDYYIITTRRAAKVERLFPIYDSRHEVPITMINAAEVETGFWGRRFGFGEVIARTWAEPPLVLEWVKHPEDVAAVLDELIRRVRVARTHEEQATIQARLRERLGLPVPQEPEAEALAAVEPVGQEDARPPGITAFVRYFTDFLFSARREQGGVVTYRKHWIFLLRRTITPLVILVGVWTVFVWHRLHQWPWPSPDALGLLVGLTSLVVFLVLIYQVWDWANDIYQITDTQILDIKAVPFGEMQRKIAPLEKVVSVDFERPSFWARVFNYGNVTIQTGPEEPLVFYHVVHPDQVQQDLFARMEALRRRKEEAEWLRQQERFIEWLAAYHSLAQEAHALEARGEPSGEAVSPLPPLESRDARADELSWEEALGFDHDPWSAPPGFPPEDEEPPGDLFESA